MRIGIDVTSSSLGGSTTYFKNFLSSLAKIDKDNEYVIFVNEKKGAILDDSHEHFLNLTIHSIYLPGKSTIWRIVWQQVVLPRLLRKMNIEILFSPASVQPIIITKHCKSVLSIRTIYPFSRRVLEETKSLKGKIILKANRQLMQLSAKSTSKVIFPSKYCLDEIKKHFNIPESKVKIVHHGRSEIFKPLDKNACEVYCRERYGIKGDFILSVSHIHLNKNYVALIDAFDTVFHSNKLRSLKLVIVGDVVDSLYYKKMLSSIDKHKLESHVMLIHGVANEELPYFYSAAKVFTLPSLCESFGNALVEAMGCGAPVTASNSTAIPEICGDAAVYYNPFKINEIANTILNVLDNPGLQNELTERGLERAHQFSWEKTARETLSVFMEVVCNDQ